MNETITALILYDNNGRIWGIFNNETEVPSGQLGFIAEVEPRPIKQITLNMSTTPPTPTIVYGRSQNDYDAEIGDLQDVVIELEARVAELEG